MITPCPECFSENRAITQPDEEFKNYIEKIHWKDNWIYVICPDCGALWYIDNKKTIRWDFK